MKLRGDRNSSSQLHWAGARARLDPNQLAREVGDVGTPPFVEQHSGARLTLLPESAAHRSNEAERRPANTDRSAAASSERGAFA